MGEWVPFSIQMDARNDGKHAPLDTASLPPLPEPLPIRISGMSPLPPFFPPFFPSFFPPFFICRHSSVLLRDNVSFQGGAVQRNACPVAGWGFKVLGGKRAMESDRLSSGTVNPVCTAAAAAAAADINAVHGVDR